MNRWIFTTLFVILCLSGLSLLMFSGVAITVQQDLSHPESMVQWAVREVAAGQALYPDWRVWPHRLMPYGPLLCLPIGLILNALDLDSFGFYIYLLGRLQSVFYLIGTWAICSVILIRCGIARWWAVVLTGAYLALWSGIIIPSTSFRADFPGLFWALVAAYIGFKSSLSDKKHYLALLPFLISVSYKPSFWAFPAAFCIFCWWKRGFKSGFLWGLFLVIGLGIYIIVAQFATDERFLLNQVGGSSLGLTTQVFEIAGALLWNPSGFPLLTWDFCARLIAAVAAAIWLLKTSEQPLAQGVAIYLLVALPVNLLTLFKVGAGLNYALETYVLGGLVLAIAGFQLYRRAGEMSAAARVIFATVGLFLFVVPVCYMTIKNAKGAIDAFENRSISDAQARLLELPDTALLGDQAFTHPAEQAHALSDPVPFAHLSIKGAIPKEPLASRIQSQAFSHFVMSAGMKYLFFSPDKANWVGKLLEEHYTPETVIPEYEIWVPKISAAAQTTATLSTPASTE